MTLECFGTGDEILDAFKDFSGIAFSSGLEEQVSSSHEYTRGAEAVSFAAWVPGLTIVSRWRRWSRLTRAREEGKLPASWATFAMVAVQVRLISHQRTIIINHQNCQRGRHCCRYDVSSPDSSTSGRVYRCLSQGRTR